MKSLATQRRTDLYYNPYETSENRKGQHTSATIVKRDIAMEVKMGGIHIIQALIPYQIS